jgi:N4-gp56 family major capsid protein
MATLSTATSNFSSTVTALVHKRLEQALRAQYPHAQPGNFAQGEMLGNGTNSVTWVGYADLAASTTQLTEGTAPTDNALTINVDTATASQVGATIAITDLAVLQSPHRLFEVAADVIADNAAKTYDVLAREILAAGTSVQYVTATSRATVATSNVITGAQVKKMQAYLTRNNVPKFGDGFFRSIIHPDSVYDLQTDTANGGWMDIWKYTDNAPLLANEVGRYAGVRFQISSNAKVFATAGASSANVYSTIFFGPSAYGISPLQNINTYFVAPGGDHSDPLAQKGIVGWKGAFACLLLDANGVRYLRLEHGTTINAG